MNGVGLQNTVDPQIKENELSKKRKNKIYLLQPLFQNLTQMKNIIWASCFKASVSIQIILEKMYSFQSDLHTDDFLIYLFYFSHEFFFLKTTEYGIDIVIFYLKLIVFSSGSPTFYTRTLVQTLALTYLNNTFFVHKTNKNKKISPATLSSIYCLQLFDSCHSDQRETVPHCGFDLHFSDNE